MRDLRTYNKTLDVEIRISAKCKYDLDNNEELTRVSYKGVTSWEIVSGYDAVEIESQINNIDDYHEYLILHFEDGSSATFRNSYVDMFIIRKY